MVDLELIHLGLKEAGDAVEPFYGRNDFQQILLFIHANQQVGGDRVGQPSWILAADRRDHRVVVQIVRELHVLLEQRHHAAHRPFDVAAGVLLRGQDLHNDAVEAFVFFPLDGAGAVYPFDQHLNVAVRQLQALRDSGHAAHGPDGVGRRVVHRRVMLRGEEHALVLRQGVLQRADGRRPPDDERHHHVREHHDITQRNDG